MCLICLSNPFEIVSNKCKIGTRFSCCGHPVCFKCLDELKENKIKVCPNCRLPLESDPIVAPPARLVALEKNVSLGKVWAMNELAEIYFDTYGMTFNSSLRERGKQLREKAAKLGDFMAQYDLGYMYMYGSDGVDKNEENALKYFKQAANQGLPHAQYQIAKNYLKNVYSNEKGELNDLRKKYTEGMELLRKAADAGDIKSQLFFGVILRNENFIAEAVDYLTKAAEKNKKAQLFLGDHYYLCQLAERNPVKAEKAIEYYEKSLWGKSEIGDDIPSDHSESRAMINLGDLYKEQNNAVKAIFNYSQALSYDKLDKTTFNDVLEKINTLRESMSKECRNCKKAPPGLSQCDRCKSVFYCSRECQVMDWRAKHKSECRTVIIPKIDDEKIKDGKLRNKKALNLNSRRKLVKSSKLIKKRIISMKKRKISVKNHKKFKSQKLTNKSLAKEKKLSKKLKRRHPIS
jgi:TPR repeat protein